MGIVTREMLDKFDRKHFPECYQTHVEDYTEIKWRHKDYVIKPWKNVDRTENYRQFEFMHLGGKQKSAKNKGV